MVGEILQSRRQSALKQALSTAEQGLEQPKTRTTALQAPGRPPKAPAQLAYLVDKFSAEFHDEVHLKSNLSQAARLWKASGLVEGAFCQLFYEAASQTKQRHIQKPAEQGGEWGLRNKMPYLFAVLRDWLGLQNERTAPPPDPPPSRQSQPGQPPRPPDDPEAYFEGPSGRLLQARQARLGENDS